MYSYSILKNKIANGDKHKILQDITVKAGETITVDVPYTGANPKPTLEFKNGERILFEDDRIKIEVDIICHCSALLLLILISDYGI